MLVLTKLSLLYQQYSKSVKTRSTKASADAPQASQTKRKGPKSTKSQAKGQKTTAPLPPPRLPIHVESSPSSLEIQTQQAPSPPQPQQEPQLEETLADVHEQIADLVGSIIASAVSSIQTSTAPPQGKASSMKSLLMDSTFRLMIIFTNFS
jgi:hypothetical protein